MFPVIDSHVHLFDEEGLDRLAWMTPTNKLNHPHTIEDYISEASTEDIDLRGVVFIETDVKSGLPESQWNDAIEEYKFAASCEKDMIKGIIPWAPIPSGRAVLQKFLYKLREAYPTGVSRVKGFRYLLQDKPRGTMTQPLFIDGLNWLSENGLVFDAGIDMHSGGIWQLDEFAQMESHVSGLKIVVNHLTKPDMMLPDESAMLDGCRELWSRIAQTTKNNYYVKISGGFSEMPEDIVNGDVGEIVQRLKPWVSLFVDVFGKEKLIWGSDWPVCTLKMINSHEAWMRWCSVTQILILELGLSREVFYDNVMSAYNL